MISPARYILYVLLLVVMMQCGLTLLVIRYALNEKMIDNHRVAECIFRSGITLPIYALPIIAHNSDRPEVIIIGASNALAGLRPELLQPYLGDVPVYNIAIKAHNIYPTRQLVDLLYRQVPTQQRQNLTFVLGISDRLFVDDSKRWPNGKTNIDEELLRYGIFKDSPDGVVPRVPDSWIAPTLEIMWPFFALLSSYDKAMCGLLPDAYRPGFIHCHNFITDEVSNTWHHTPQQRIDSINGNNAYMGHDAYSNNRAFEHLLYIAERVSASGGHLVIIDLPTSAWLHDAVTSYAKYQRLKLPYIERLTKLKNISYLNLQEGFDEDALYDGVHPRARIMPEIARRAAVPIRKALADINHPANSQEH